MYIFGIDETGNTSSFNNSVKLIKEGGELTEQDSKFFLITLVKISSDEYIKLQDEINNLKDNFGIPRTKAIHAVEFVKRRGKYSRKWKLPKLLAFINALEIILEKIDFRFYYTIIDVVSHINKYAEPFDPYGLSMEYLFERVLMDVENKKFKIYAEGRGEKEDDVAHKAIKKELSRLKPNDDFEIFFDTKKSTDYQSIIELTDIICYLLRMKYIKLNNPVKQLQKGGYLSKDFIRHLENTKMKYNRLGYDKKYIP